MQERLQKIISRSGAASRRAAEKLIDSGRVTVNGRAAALGESADPETDEIAIDGAPLPRAPQLTYIMLNKPRGYVTTMSDEKGRRDVSMLVRGTGLRLYPVGRLDMYSEGLLLMTNDGDVACRLMHPSHSVDKTYHLWVTGEDVGASADAMAKSMLIDGWRIRPATVERLGRDGEYDKLAVTIHEGRNRQIRKMCSQCSLKLHRLVRVSEGELSLGRLEPGKWRYLTEKELEYLHSLL